MRSLVIMSVVLGVAFGQGFPRETPEVHAARNAFILEYNRLAELAALAPDIHIYHATPRPGAAHTSLPSHVAAPPAFNAYSFSASLGGNQQFIPGPNTFPSTGHHAGHLAGHLAGHHAGHRAGHVPAPQPATHRFAASPDTISKWTGPLADEVPAGVQGNVQDTANVAAAKDAHFRAHAAALGIRV
ncbi:uncharacterized protein LOC121859864 [Homarus americanus]|uniref:Uncharacterized protein n=1 Tax=Homarus americanus TaxID=6706 RepID=A0A8J5TCQ3_HOMAM|nr:uncharacterized protein LOC121859864 [Homarus americanus]KAG7173985.1 hypothetical protein Hamer_G025118 [Homarus americanus]